MTTVFATLKIPFLSLAVILLMLSASEASARLLVAVTVPAQAWLVKQIAGERVDLLTMVPAGHVPESAQPGPRNLIRFQQADIHFTVGHPAFFFETRYIQPYREKSDARTWLSMFDIAGQMTPTRRLTGSDPHLWTSPSIMMVSANAVEQTLARLEPENADLFRNNLQLLQEKVTGIDDQIRTLVERRDSDKLLVYHPAWGHFCQDFALQQLAIEDEGKAPGAGSLSGIFASLGKNKINFIISSPGADQRSAAMIAEQFQINLVMIDPMDPDWMHMMLDMKEALETKKNND